MERRLKEDNGDQVNVVPALMGAIVNTLPENKLVCATTALISLCNYCVNGGPHKHSPCRWSQPMKIRDSVDMQGKEFQEHEHLKQRAWR